jgi:hypothetical protein
VAIWEVRISTQFAGAVSCLFSAGVGFLGASVPRCTDLPCNTADDAIVTSMLLPATVVGPGGDF